MLSIKQLTKKYKIGKKTITALDNINLDITKGKTLGIVGESGSGKSTLARIILALEKPTFGKVYFKNNEIFSLTKKEIKSLRKNMQIIFQDPAGALNPRMKISQILKEPYIIHKIAPINIYKLLDLVGLEKESANKYPHEFSGGQKQRIVIARALSLTPDLLILDEPVSSLDVSIQAQIINLLKDLQKEFNLTYLFIAHDLAMIKYISDDIIVMNKGKIVELGIKKNIYNNPQNIYTKNLLKSILKMSF